MIRLNHSSYDAVYPMYRRWNAFFPLIGAVLLKEQDGAVYADSIISPQQIYVEHAFGFAQTFGTPCSGFEAALKQYLFVDKDFIADKVRLYTPHQPLFFSDSNCIFLLSYRQRFVLDDNYSQLNFKHYQTANLEVVTGHVDHNNVGIIEDSFGVVRRFWRTAEDFINKSYSTVAFVNTMPAAICYAAAIANGRAEIDVLTLPKYRHLGLGKTVVTSFIRRCYDSGLEPIWDCYSNNSASISLCMSSGFVPAADPYPFYTINK